MKKIGILQSNYIPWKGYFDLINSVDTFVIYDEVQYTKNDWRNRNVIKTRNGKEWLTIPVRQKNLGQRINETLVTLRNWNVKHWNAIVTNYSKAHRFNEVKSFVQHLYLDNPHSMNLSEINQKFIIEICRFLNISTEIIVSDTMELRGNRNEKLIDACSKLKGDIYLSGPSAKDYLDVGLFKAQGITVEWMNYNGYPEYPQLFPPFDHQVTILDVILNTGTAACNYTKKNFL